MNRKRGKTITRDKIVSVSQAARAAERARRRGETVVTTSGCFDILHAGHISSLEWARSQGDMLIVGINSDRTVRSHKGPGRPITVAKDRARTLAGLGAVDYVFVFDSYDPRPWLARIHPHIHVKGSGSERHPLFKPEADVVRAHGGRVRLAPKIPGKSTTKILEKVLARHRRGSHERRR